VRKMIGRVGLLALAGLAACGGGSESETPSSSDCTVLSASSRAIELPVRQVLLEVKFIGVEPGGIERLGIPLDGFSDMVEAGDFPLGGSFCGSGRIAAPSDAVGGVEGGLNAVGDDQFPGGLLPLLALAGMFPPGTEDAVPFVNGPGPDGFDVDPFDAQPLTNLPYSLNPPFPSPSTGITGFSVGHTLLDDPQVEVILRAVTSDSARALIEAPRVVTLNTQTATVITHEAELPKGDFIPEFQQAANAFDPNLSVLSTGITLVLTPTIAADGTTINLEVRPARGAFALGLQPLDISGQLSRIKMPMIGIHRARTTVSLPNGGTLVLGGLRTSPTDPVTGGVPFFRDIPVLGASFNAKARIKNSMELMIFIKPRILDTP